MGKSSSDSQLRCPCGFWGSTKTLGLCSVCYRKAHRSQSQTQSLSFDAGKSSVGSCSNQSESSQGTKMDSKPFPSRSTTDNLPSSLSSPPGERTALTATSSSAIDTTTTTSGSSTSAHISSVLAASSGNGDIGQPGPSSTIKQSCEQLPDHSDTDTCSSASTDQSYDISHDPGATSGLSSVVCSIASTYSSSSSIAASLSSTTTLVGSGDHKAITSQALESQISAIFGLQSDPKPSSQTSTSISGSNITSGVSNSNAAASTKNNTDRSKERGEEHFDSLLSQDKTSPASSSVQILPLIVASGSVVDKSPECSAQRGIKRSREEMEMSSDIQPTASPQKNKRRCFTCSCKLELAQRTIGHCRCDRVFCALHRLPELHGCDFNHKEDGRREAREKMIKPTRHLGPSYRREDHS
ncbi:serine-rich adhesin for platelets [Biomphalaria glabrata]|nr:serine-rich adhesin for platelets-like [Biomphalaria glabrata]